ncbi:hypothetical protein DFH09DRAFT_1113077 [Mycena vulgaris]|nr:hypothetical protein DFH09DRAFT_1113077 [Mycena vulgaris]
MTDSQTLSVVSPWKTKRFREYELSWTKSTDSLLGDSPVIEIRPNKDGTRWTVYNKATDKIAIFFHAGIWAWASPPETGNFVPEGESAPEGVHPARIQPVLGKYVETSYGINTEEDPSFYKGAKASFILLLENYATSLKAFNKYKKPRRAWQDGDTEFNRRRFVLAARILLRSTPMNSKVGAETHLPYKLHPWLRDALSAQKFVRWIPNPEMPAILDYVDGKLQMLRPTHNRYFDSGDVVWFSFALSFDVNSSNWMPEYKPLDFIRVGSLPHPSENRIEYSAADEVGSAYRSLASGAATLLDDSDELYMAIDNDVDGQGRKRARDSDGDDTMSDGGFSDKSAYSATQAALDGAVAKKPKVEEDDSGGKPQSKKATGLADDIAKKKVPPKSKR